MQFSGVKEELSKERRVGKGAPTKENSKCKGPEVLKRVVY